MSISPLRLPDEVIVARSAQIAESSAYETWQDNTGQPSSATAHREYSASRGQPMLPTPLIDITALFPNSGNRLMADIDAGECEEYGPEMSSPTLHGLMMVPAQGFLGDTSIADLWQLPAVGDPSVPPADGTCLWDGLPTEIQATVFELAYVPDRPVKPITLHEWEMRESQRKVEQRRKFVAQDFENFHEQQLPWVSKEWGHASAHTFYSHAHFQFRDVTAISCLTDQVRHSKFITKFTLTLDDGFLATSVGEICRFPMLKALNLKVTKRFLQDYPEKEVFVDIWDEADFYAYEPSRALLHSLCGRPGVTVKVTVDETSFPWLRIDDEPRSVFDSNMQELIRFVGEAQKRPKQASCSTPSSSLASSSPVPEHTQSRRFQNLPETFANFRALLSSCPERLANYFKDNEVVLLDFMKHLKSIDGVV
jgi:hypothetical protein